MRKVSMATRAELILAIRGRYASAGRPEKAKILDEFVALTGFHRKHAMRLLRGSDEPAKGGARPGRRIYGDAVRVALVLPQPSRGYIRPGRPYGSTIVMAAAAVKRLSCGTKCYRYSSVTCPNRRSTCLSLNLPISKSLVRLNATEPAWPNTLQSAWARCIAAAGLGQSMGSPAAIAPSMKSKGNATKEVISAIGSTAALTIILATELDPLPDVATVPHDRAPRRDRACRKTRRTVPI